MDRIVHPRSGLKCDILLAGDYGQRWRCKERVKTRTGTKLKNRLFWTRYRVIVSHPQFESACSSSRHCFSNVLRVRILVYRVCITLWHSADIPVFTVNKSIPPSHPNNIWLPNVPQHPYWRMSPWYSAQLRQTPIHATLVLNINGMLLGGPVNNSFENLLVVASWYKVMPQCRNIKYMNEWWMVWSF